MTESSAQVVNKYNDVPYSSFPYPNTHPERLFTIGKLFGMKPVDFKNCKVLELGCASGGNIIPMATLLPNSSFTGIDLSEVQIKQGQEHIDTLSIKNVTLKTMSITDITAKFGKFDYIIAHGILSWVPKNVQDKIFEIFNNNLTKNGIAYVSYNTLPGWNAIRSIREMMLFHTRNFENPADKVREARLLLKFITDANAGNKTPYAQGIDEEIATLNQCDDTYLLHDHLEDTNEPFYFHEVAERAAGNDLQYLGDTGLASMFVGNLPTSAAEILSGAAADAVKVEQYMDFIRNRRFRSSLFCHKDVAINRHLQGKSLENFYLLSQITVDQNIEEIDFTSRKEFSITFSNGTILQTNNPAVMLAMKILSQQQGKPLATEELINKVFNVIGNKTNQEATRTAILDQLLRLVLADAVGIFSDSGSFVTAISNKPKASALSRYQASKNNWITNQRAEKNNIDLFNRVLIQYLTGDNDFDTILNSMLKHVENDDLVLNIDGNKVVDKAQMRSVVEQLTKQNIENLIPRALLVA